MQKPISHMNFHDLHVKHVYVLRGQFFFLLIGETLITPVHMTFFSSYRNVWVFLEKKENWMCSVSTCEQKTITDKSDTRITSVHQVWSKSLEVIIMSALRKHKAWEQRKAAIALLSQLSNAGPTQQLQSSLIKVP